MGWGVQAPPWPCRGYLWKVQVTCRVMAEVPFFRSRCICSRLGGLMLHSAPELPSMLTATMSSSP